MILRIRLRDWRSYSDVTIELDRPVVFFVAPNGVGKTSLFEAVRRCLFGFPKGRAAGRSVRSGADRAELSIDLLVGSAGPITVTRTLTRTGRPTFKATSRNASLSEEQFKSILSREWASDPALLDRLVFGDADPVRRGGEALPIREQLADLLGVTPLLVALADIRTAKATITNTISGLRVEAASATADLGDAERALTNAQQDLDSLTAERVEVRDRLRSAKAAIKNADDWARHRVAAAKYNASVEEVLADIGRLVSVDPADPSTSLEQARAAADATLAATRQSAVDAELAATKAARASELLADGDHICPTCLRPLTETERAVALHFHGGTAAEATAGTARARDDAARFETHLRAIEEFTRRLDRLQPPAPPRALDPGPEAAAELQDAQTAETRVAEQFGEARSRVETATAAVLAAQRRQRDTVVLERAAREELLLETTANAFEQVADQYLAERIEPLRHDIEHRWKLVFGKDGLVLGPAGEIRLQQGEITLEPEDMSGGERAIAGVIVRLLVTAAVTRIPTLWFDEPLEHLDPRRRASVARTLVQAATVGTVHQIIATTYEEGIARRLAHAAPDLVAVVYADNQTPRE